MRRITEQTQLMSQIQPNLIPAEIACSQGKANINQLLNHDFDSSSWTRIDWIRNIIFSKLQIHQVHCNM